MADLDRFDHSILTLMQQHNLTSHEELGLRVGLSASAVRRRLKFLRESRVIAADVSIVNPETVGISVIVSIRFEKESHATYEAFKSQMKALPEVAQCYTVSGETDFIVIGHFADLPSYEVWIGQYLLSNPAIARSDTNIVYSRVKFSTAILTGV
jgi:Lrp/AsnC family transcriptional regulator, leucine-responsive regulatory protein